MITQFPQLPVVTGSEFLVCAYDPSPNYKLTINQLAAFVAAPSGALLNPMSATGDIIFGGTLAGGFAVPSRLGVGTVGQFLGVSAGLPAWTTLATVATTGIYSDLTGKPTLGTVASLSYPGGTTTFLRADGTFAVPPPFTGGTLTSALNEAPPVTLASAATVNIGAAPANTVNITGTTTITAFDVIAAGSICRLVFGGVLTLTHNITSLILPGFANITTAAGDVATMLSLGSGNWKCIDYSKASGTSVVGTPASLANWTEAVATAAPNNVIPAVSFTATNGSTNVDAVISAKGTGALLAQVADGTSNGGNKRGTNAVDFQRTRSASTSVASGNWAVISGGNLNTASGTESFIGGGTTNVNSGSQGVLVGGSTNTLSAIQGVVAGGSTNNSSADYGVIGGGFGNIVSGIHSCVPGGRQASTRGLMGVLAHASGRFGTTGDAQAARYVLRRNTTDATLSGLSADGGLPAATTSIVLPNNSVYAFEALITAKVTTFGDRATYKITGQVSRNASAAATQIDGAPTVTTIATIGGASAWTVAAVANTTLGSLEIRVAGVAATTINWVSRVETVETTA